MGTASQELADFIVSLRFEDLPGAVTSAAKRHLTDACGVALAAAARGAGSAAIEMTHSWGGAREAGIIGTDIGAPAPFAALANGILIHSLNFDDTHIESMLHPSACIVPAALAVAEEVGASGAQTLVGIVAGCETAARVAACAPGRFHARGLDTTGVCGTFGAAAAAARIWGLSAEETANALGIAGSPSSGVLASLWDGTDAARMHGGWAAHAGVIAADLARRGSTGPQTIFEGPGGFFDAFLAGEEPHRARLVRGLGTEWETLRIAIKPHAACHFLHAYIDAAAQIGVRWADIEEVICGVAPAMIATIAEPRAHRLHPASFNAAQYSLPFAVAAAIVGGREGTDLFDDDARGDRRVLTLAERVRHEPDTTLPFPSAYGASIRVHTRAGHTHEVREEINRGHPDRPLNDPELNAKFMRNASARLGEARAHVALGCLQRVESMSATEVSAALSTV